VHNAAHNCLFTTTTRTIDFKDNKIVRVWSSHAIRRSGNLQILFYDGVSAIELLYRVRQLFSEFLKMTKTYLKGQSHEKVYEFLTWDGSFSLN
jgi:hypothetical protein